jgi:hypothetical protein
MAGDLGGDVTVRCAVCHREERWSADGRVLEVVVDGGIRRTADDPQWARGRTALASAAGELPPVVGVCEACGQYMVGEGGPIPVRVDTPEGALVVDGAVITGPGGAMSREQAAAFLERQYRRPITEGLAGDLGRLSLLVWLGGPLLYWLFSLFIMGTFVAALLQEPPAAVVGKQDW